MTYLSKTNYVRTAANIATALFAFFIGAQLLLAAGILPVSMFWGGRITELTPGLRIGSLVAVAVLGFFIYVIRYRAGLVGVVPTPKWVRVSAWLVTGYMALNMLGNLASLSNVERFLFSPITLVLTVASLLVAASRAK